MPRLAMDERERFGRAVVSRVDAYLNDCRRRKIERKHAIAKLGFVSNTTLNSRLHEPGDFKLSELIIIANTMNISIGTLLGLDK